MKHLFNRWLFIFVAISLIIAGSIVWFIYSYDSQTDALDIMRNNLAYVSKLLEKQDSTIEELMTRREKFLQDAHAFARELGKNASETSLAESIENYRVAKSAAGVSVVNGSGIVECSTFANLVGGDISRFKLAKRFMKGLGDPDFEDDAYEDDDLYCVCVGRQDAPGLIIFVFDSLYSKIFKDLADVGNIERSFCVGYDAELRIAPNEIGWKSGEKIFKEKRNGRTYLCISQPHDDRILTGGIPMDEIYLAGGHVFAGLAIGFALVSLASYYAVSLLLQKLVIENLRGVDNELNKIANGDLDVRVNYRSVPEFAMLSDCANAMVDSLKKAIERERRRIDAELKLCMTIQNSLLPTSSDFTFGDDYEIFTLMLSAKEVSGDFYDYFAIDDERFAVLIADVSDKGITAAMYMASTKVLLKNLLQTGMSPEKAFNEANQQLSRNNKASMFLTAFALVFNSKTGRATAVNAGHCPPAIKRANGEWQFEKVERSFPLGVADIARYGAMEIELRPGDSLFLFTDGVTDTMDVKGNLFGDVRLLNALNEASDGAQETVDSVRKALEKYSVGAPQSDDVTAVALKRLQK